MDVKLVMFTADGTRRDFSLSRPRVVVGRTTTCDLRIPLSSVSRKHCEFHIADDQTVGLRDLKSSNGTFHNGQRIEQATVKAGDQVKIGPVLFTVVINGEPQAIESTPTILGGQSGDSSHATVSEDSRDSASGTAAVAPRRAKDPRDQSAGSGGTPLDASALAADVLAETGQSLHVDRGSADLGSADLDASGVSDDSMAGLDDGTGDIPLAIDEEEEEQA